MNVNVSLLSKAGTVEDINRDQKPSDALGELGNSTHIPTNGELRILIEMLRCDMSDDYSGQIYTLLEIIKRNGS